MGISQRKMPPLVVTKDRCVSKKHNGSENAVSAEAELLVWNVTEPFCKSSAILCAK